MGVPSLVYEPDLAIVIVTQEYCTLVPPMGASLVDQYASMLVHIVGFKIIKI